MRLDRLVVRNFLAIEFAEVDFRQQGVVYIEGQNLDRPSQDSNGSGKSSLFVEAPIWCLYDTTLRGLSKDAVVNRYTASKSDTSVQLFFMSKGKQVDVTRYRKHKEHKNNLVLIIDGVDSSGTTTSLTEETLKSLIPPADIFLRTAVLGQGLENRFTSLTDDQKKSLLEEIVGSAIFDTAKSRALQSYRDAQVEVARLEGLIAEQDRTKTSREEQLTKAREASKGFEEQRRLALEALEKEISERKTEATKKISELEELAAKEETVKKERETWSQRRDDARSLLSRATLSVTHSEKMLKEIRERSSKVPGVGVECPFCLRIMPEDTWQEKQSALSHQIDEAERHVNQAKEDEAQSKTVNAEAEKHYQEADREWYVFQRTLGSLKDQAGRVSADLLLLKTRKKQKQDEKDVHALQVDTIETELEELGHRQEETKASLSDLSLKLEYLKFWDKGFSILRGRMLSSVLPFMNTRLSTYLDSLSEGELRPLLTLKQKGSKEVLELVVNDEPYQACSGGERRRVDLALALSLHDLTQMVSGFQTNFLVADEVADSLDPTGVDRFLRFLADRQVESVFIISHNPILRSAIDKKWIVEKKNKLARLKTS